MDVFDYYSKINFVNNTPPFIKEYENGVVFPFGGEHTVGVFDSAEFCPGMRTSDEEVVYLGFFSVSHYGVMLVDDISRLWYEDGGDKKYIFTAKDSFETTYLMRFLDLLGIPRDHVEKINVPTRYKCISVPAIAFRHGRYVLPVFCSIYERMAKGMKVMNIATYDKIYLTRRRLKKRKEVGEKKIELFFETNGYRVIALEQYPIEGQAVIMRNAHRIASIEGTHAHGIVWRNPENNNQCKQIILRKQSEFIPRQMMLNSLWNIETTYIDVFEEPFCGFPITHDRGPFLIRWTEQIERFARDNNMVIPPYCHKRNVMEYVEYSFKCSLYFIKHHIKKIVKREILWEIIKK